jgi:hypothetical protein
MKVHCFRAVTPFLALGLFLVTQALGRPQSHLSGGDRPGPEPKVAAKMVSASENLVNQILHNEQLAIGRNDRLLGQESRINQRLFALYRTTPATPAMARIIQAQIERQLALFDQIERHLTLDKLHIGDNRGYDAQVARAMAIMGRAAAARPAIIADIMASMRLQMMLSDRLRDIAALPPATPYRPLP